MKTARDLTFLVPAWCLASSLLGQDAPKPGSADNVRYSFEQAERGGRPAGFEVAETKGAGKTATWHVDASDAAPDGRQVVAVQTNNSGETYNLLLTASDHVADLTVAVWVRANAGGEDQGGGVVWRAKDADNYYVARWNPLEDNVRLYKVENGKRTMFESADVTADPAAWHRLAVTMRGDSIAVVFDGKEVLRRQDSTFAGKGRIGLWTKADASSSFDLLEVAPAPSQLVSRPAAEAPTVDGSGTDAAWQAASSLAVSVRRVLPPDVGKQTELQIRSIHTGDQIFFLVRWRDATRDDAAHKPWHWNTAKSAYEEGSEREDMLTLAFAHTGEFDPDMLSGKEAVWDVWQWKAVRTNPQRFAMDRTHRYTRAKPEGKAKEHRTPGGSIWIARPEDEGATVEQKQPAPASRAEDLVLQYLPGTPTGSAADVRAKASWDDGWWTLELLRRLDTKHADDTTFVLGERLLMAVATHDRTGDMDKASAAIELTIERGKQ